MRLKEFAEIQTLALILFCYLGTFFLVLNPYNLSLLITAIFLIPLITLHSSLQHECLHGHPFRNQNLNDSLVVLSLGLFIPYYRFKDTHLKHHNNQTLTDPVADPESWYLDEESWTQKPPHIKRLLQLNNCLAGRILLGPAIIITAMWYQEIIKGTAQLRKVWAAHTMLMGLYLLALNQFTAMPLWVYFICCYIGLSILGIRTFLEHQAHEKIGNRTVIIEDKGPLSWLFLNNNLHVIHHAYPALAWYRLPQLFKRNRDRFLKRNQGYYFKSYATVFKHYIVTAKEPVLYPLKRQK